MKSIKNIFICVAYLAAFPLFTFCQRSNNENANLKKSKTGAIPNKVEVTTKDEWAHTLALISRVKNGDGNAAYELVGYYAIEKQDAASAYFWAVQAKKLHHPLATDDFIKSLEDGVWSVLPDDKKRQSLDPRYENVLPSE